MKIPLLPYNVDKKSVNNSGLTVGSRQEPTTIKCYLSSTAMAYLDDKILACAGNNLSHTCFNYDPILDTWSVISNSSYGHEYMPGVVSDNKIYLADDTNPESKNACYLKICVLSFI